MKTHIFLFLFLCAAITSVAQHKYTIVYNKPATIRVNSEQAFYSIYTYNVDFLNANGQIVKHMDCSANEDHHAKMGYRQEEYTSYHFYTDSVLTFSIGIDITSRIFYKTIYTYQDGKEIICETYGTKPRISKDSFQYTVANDVFLNFPERFPVKNLLLDVRTERRYENGKMVYKCYYERYGKAKTAEPRWEHLYQYNSKGQMTAYTTMPCEATGGAASWKDTLNYNDSGKLVKVESYHDDRHWSTKEYTYSKDSIVEKETYYYSWPSEQPQNHTTTRVYKLDSDGLYYTGRYHAQFFLPNYTE